MLGRAPGPTLARHNGHGPAVAEPEQQAGGTPVSGPGAWIPHRYCRNDGPPPNPAIPEDLATCEALLRQARAALARQRLRADSLVGGPNGPVRDFRYFFARVYSYVTENEIRFVTERAYYYPSYVLRSVLYFEQIYEDNFRAWDRQKGHRGQDWRTNARFASRPSSHFARRDRHAGSAPKRLVSEARG